MYHALYNAIVNTTQPSKINNLIYQLINKRLNLTLKKTCKIMILDK